MAFKIQNFYGGSPLKSSSPDRELSSGDMNRKQKKLDKTNERLENNDFSLKKSNRLERKRIKTEDQLERGMSGISDAADKKSAPFYMKDEKLDAMMKKKATLEKRIADIKAKAAKENKIGNWDDASDQLSRLNERIAEYKSKNPK